MHVIVFTGGKFPLPCKTKTYFDNIQSPSYVIAADSGIDTLDCYQEYFDSKINFYPNEILGDMDSIENKALLKKYKDAKLTSFPCDKYFSDSEIALDAAMRFKQLSQNINEKMTVTLIGGGGGRLDHLLALYDWFSEPSHADVWLCENEALYYLPHDSVASINGISETEIISIARKTTGREGCSFITEGLEWEGDCFRKTGMPSLSNRIKKDYVERHKPAMISIKGGDCLLIVPLHAVISIKGLPQER